MSTFKKSELLYEGKAKKLFAVESDPNKVWLEFKDSLTAYNAQKKGSFKEKGAINAQITDSIFRYLMNQGVATHWVEKIDDFNFVTLNLKMIPLEVVVRNRLAGSTAKKFGREEGAALPKPLFEFYFKDDELQDPFVSHEQVEALQLVEDIRWLPKLKDQALVVNEHLKELFSKVGIELIDFKLEYGVDSSGQLILADEISPDSCRLWDVESGERMDKDRFRRDLGQVKENYREILRRLKQIEEL